MFATLFSSLQHHKTKLIVVSFIVVGVGIISTAFTEKKAALAQTKTFCLENIKQFQSQLDTFQKAAEDTADKKLLLARFKKARVAFKRFEFCLEYIDNNRYPFF